MNLRYRVYKTVFPEIFIRIWPLLSVLILLGTPAAYGQYGSIIINHLTTENGLPQNTINDLYLDKQGFLWIVTEKGLVRYDGLEFVRMMPANDNDIFKSENLIELAETGAGKLVLFHPFYGTYNIDSHPVKCPHIGQSVFNEENDCFGKAISYYPKILSQQEKYRKELDIIKGKVFTEDSTIYIWEYYTLFCFNKEGLKKITLSPNLYHSKVGLSGNTLLIIQENNTLSLVCNSRLLLSMPLEDIFSEENPFDINEFKVLNYKNECYIYSRNILYNIDVSGKTIKVSKLLTGLDLKSPKKLVIDHKNGIYYIGTKYDGIFIVKNNPYKNVIFSGIHEKSFYAQAKIDESNYITNGCYVNREKGMIRRLSIPGEPYTYLVDEDKKLWLSNFSYLVRLDPETSTTLWEKKISPYSNCIRTSPFDNKKYTALATRIYCIENGALVNLNIPEFIPNNNIISFLFSGKTRIMCATNKGLFQYDTATHVTKALKTTGIYRCLEPDKNKKDIWVGSYGDGFYLYSNDSLYKMPLDRDQCLANVHAFAEDSMQRIWMSTNNGLVVVAKQELMKCLSDTTFKPLYRVFTVKDGLASSEFNGGCYPSHMVFNDGVISFPSLNGIIQFNPASIPDWNLPNHVFVKKMHVDGRVINDYDNNIVIDHDFQQIFVSVVTPFLNLYKKNEIKYAIVNNDKITWQNVPDDGKILINNLKSGSYSLLFKTDDGKGDITTFHITIQKAFYESLWFGILCGLAFILILFGFSKLNNRRLKLQNEILEKKVEDRTLAQQETIKELDRMVHKLLETEKNLNENVTVKEQLISLVLHDMRSPLNYLRLAVDNLHRNINIYSKEHIESELFDLKEGVEEIHAFSKTFFEWVNFQRHGINLNPSETSLNEIFYELLNLFKGITARNGNQLFIKETDIVVFSDKNILITILRNILDNANKNTAKGTIWLTARTCKEGDYVIELTDTGPGMSKDIIEKIENAFISNENKSDLPGFGFKLIIELLPMINARISIVNNNPAKGVTISIFLKNIEEDDLDSFEDIVL